MRQEATATADNIRAIVEVETQARRQVTFGERVGQWITDRIGTLAFVLAHAGVMLAWIAWNLAAPRPLRFDPYPFGLMTFIVSLEGVLVAIFVLIAQNRLSRHTNERDHLNLQINMLAEQELTVMLKLVRRIADCLDVPPETVDEARAENLAEETNVYELVKELRRELPDEKGG